MNLLFMQNGLPPYGIPRNGLVSIIDPGRQILTGTTGQTAIDYSGHGNTFQLGSTAGSDTNDPAWSGNGLVFGTDDFVTLPTLSDVDITKTYTIITALYAPASTSDYCIWGKGISASNRQELAILAGKVSFGTYNGTVATAKQYQTIVENKAIVAGLTCKQNAIGLFVNNNKIATTGALTATPVNGHYLGYNFNGNRWFNGGNMYVFAVYNRVLSDAEYMTAYNGLRRLMLSRGVVI